MSTRGASAAGSPPLFAIALLSSAAIGYEILLARLFSILLWHHFAYMIISVALLGVGAAGTFLAFARPALERRYHGVVAIASAGFGLTAVTGFALAQRIAFNPLEIAWDPAQQFNLLKIYLLLAVPFFAAATAVGLSLGRFPARAGHVYRADLCGAGCGAVAIVGVLFVLPAEDCLRVIAALGLLAAAAAMLAAPRQRWLSLPLLLTALLSTALWPQSLLELRPSAYKGLSSQLTLPQTRIIASRSSPLGRIDVVQSPAVPFRHAPGLSLRATVAPPEQLGVYTDADGLMALTRFNGDTAPLAYLDQQTAALPYHLDPPRSTLVLGAGAGAGLLRAIYHGAERIDAVELDAHMANLMRGEFREFSGALYERPEVRLHIAEARSFAAASKKRWDLVQLALLDSFTATAAGVQALSGSSLYTVEALDVLLRRLSPGGTLAITRWLRVPPRENLKLFATATLALERHGVVDPDRQLVMIRSWSTVTLLVREAAFETRHIDALRAFCERRGFDLVWYPGMPATEANRFSRFDRPYLHDGARALLGPQRADFIASYPFHIEPASDDRPYFFRSFRWQLLPEVLALRQQAALTLLDSGYLVLVGTLAQSVLASIVLIVLPLLWLRRDPDARTGIAAWRVVCHFIALGLGFLFVEIAFMQRLTLILGHPLGAVAVVLAGFLLFAGLGSGVSQRLADTRIPRATAAAVFCIALLASGYLLLLPTLLEPLMTLPLAARVILVLALIAPLGFAMGFPFPLGLRRVAAASPRLVPLAWAVNGCASVIAASLASLLAMHLGISALVGLALLAYLLAALSLTDAAEPSET